MRTTIEKVSCDYCSADITTKGKTKKPIVITVIVNDIRYNMDLCTKCKTVAEADIAALLNNVSPVPALTGVPA